MCSIREEKSDIYSSTLIVGFWLGIICGMTSSLFNSTFSLDQLRLFSLNTVLSINTWAGFTLFSTSFGLTSHLLLYFLVMGAVGFTPLYLLILFSFFPLVKRIRSLEWRNLVAVNSS